MPISKRLDIFSPRYRAERAYASSCRLRTAYLPRQPRGSSRRAHCAPRWCYFKRCRFSHIYMPPPRSHDSIYQIFLSILFTPFHYAFAAVFMPRVDARKRSSYFGLCYFTPTTTYISRRRQFYAMISILRSRDNIAAALLLRLDVTAGFTDILLMLIIRIRLCRRSAARALFPFVAGRCFGERALWYCFRLRVEMITYSNGHSAAFKIFHFTRRHCLRRVHTSHAPLIVIRFRRERLFSRHLAPSVFILLYFRHSREQCKVYFPLFVLPIADVYFYDDFLTLRSRLNDIMLASFY